MYKRTAESGIALLMTLIVVGVLTSVGLSILDLSLKQVRLSTNAKESEKAFHAANAGMECARYIRRIASSTMESGGDITADLDCFNGTLGGNTVSQVPAAQITGDGDVYQYQYEFTWGPSSDRCTQINTLVAYSSPLGTGVDIAASDVQGYLPGYPSGTNLVCDPGARCTAISVQGYNKPCATVGGYGTVQREVLLQF